MMGLNDETTEKNYKNNIDKILKSKHFINRYDNIKPLFEKITEFVLSEFRDEISKIQLSFNKSYIGFYSVESNKSPRLFITIRTKNSKEEESSLLHVSLKTDNPHVRELNNLELSIKTNRRDEGDFDFKTLDKFKEKIEAIKYSYNACIEN